MEVIVILQLRICIFSQQAIFDEHHLTQAYLFRLRLEQKIMLRWGVFNPVDHLAAHGQMYERSHYHDIARANFFWQTHTHCAHAAVATPYYLRDKLPSLSESNNISCEALPQYLFGVGQITCLSQVAVNLHQGINEPFPITMHNEANTLPRAEIMYRGPHCQARGDPPWLENERLSDVCIEDHYSFG